MTNAAQGADLRERSSIGYAINMVQDYGNGRSVTISGTLPLQAPLKEFNAELDKLRLASSRQSALVIKRDREALLRAKQKQLIVIEAARDEYQRQMEIALEAVANEPANKHAGGKLLTAAAAQLQTLRQQAINDRMAKEQELNQTRGEIEMCKAIIESCDLEIAAIDKLEG